MNNHRLPGQRRAHLHACWFPCLVVSAALALVGCQASPGENVGQTAQAVCSSATLSPSVPSAAPGTSVTWTATAGCDDGDVPNYQFWLQAPGGDWASVQSYSESGTYAWDTTGATPGTYNVGVWVLAEGSGAPYEGFTLASYDVVFDPCTNAALSFSAVGSEVTLTGSATCDGTPEYQFWAQASDGSWSISQAYSTSDTFALDTTTFAPGDYTFGVWVYNQGSTAAYETFGFGTYTVAGACTDGNLVTDTTSPSTVGPLVTLTASATCATAAEYEFWVQTPDGTWTSVQDYSAATTFAWDTSSAIDGDYQLGVWARLQGSTAQYETFSIIPFTLAD